MKRLHLRGLPNESIWVEIPRIVPLSVVDKVKVRRAKVILKLLVRDPRGWLEPDDQHLVIVLIKPVQEHLLVPRDAQHTAGRRKVLQVLIVLASAVETLKVAKIAGVRLQLGVVEVLAVLGILKHNFVFEFRWVIQRCFACIRNAEGHVDSHFVDVDPVVAVNLVLGFKERHISGLLGDKLSGFDVDLYAHDHHRQQSHECSKEG
jgi:hypothetical protein